MPMVALWALLGSAVVQAREVSLKLIETTDVHGSYYPYDFINRKAARGSLARVSTMVDEVRKEYGDSSVVLFDNGDILQGQPIVYYYNYMDTVSPHLTAEMMNFMRYDVGTIGNHDVETGHAVYDRWIAQCRFPMLGANVIDVKTGEPYLKPYVVLERSGVKIAVLGMITPSIPAWLPETLWKGLRFDDMVETARRWVSVIEEKEHPDVMVGLFHSGRDSTKTSGAWAENASLLVAKHVPGFDLIFMGHDHSPYVNVVTNDAGGKVLVLNPANNAMRVADVDLTCVIGDDGKVKSKHLSGQLLDVRPFAPSTAFMDKFSGQLETVKAFVSKKIGHTSSTLTTRDAYFGPSAFVDMIHGMQLAITGADISFAAPLSFDATIAAGDIRVSDMFNLYKYENMLYTMELTGREIKDYLEMSYDLWTNRMSSADDHLLKLRDNPNGDDMTHTGFRYPSYNFDSAAGIRYEVDVTKPRGEKVTILSMADGKPFDMSRKYKVAVNSYRGNGGGNLLTRGAGIAASELKGRILTSTDRDLRYYLMDYIKNHPNLNPKPLNQWRFVPVELVAPAAARDRALLFKD